MILRRGAQALSQGAEVGRSDIFPAAAFNCVSRGQTDYRDGYLSRSHAHRPRSGRRSQPLRDQHAKAPPSPFAMISRRRQIFVFIPFVSRGSISGRIEHREYEGCTDNDRDE